VSLRNIKGEIIVKKIARFASAFLALTLLLSATPVWGIEGAEQSAAPMPPSWWDEADYLVFDGDEIYQGSQWSDILAAREEVLSGTAKEGDSSSAYGRFYTDHLLTSKATPAQLYEAALLDIGAFLTGGKTTTSNAHRFLHNAARVVGEDHPYYRSLTLWDLRCILMDRHLQKDSNYELSVRFGYLSTLNTGMERCGITLEELYSHPLLEAYASDREDTAAKLEQFREELAVKQAEQAIKDEAERLRLKIYLDGVELKHSDTQPVILNGRTMVPIYELAQALGCGTAWDEATQTATLTQAGNIVQLTIGSKTAYVNGKPVVMDVAPYLLQARTMIPIAYVARFFGQSVQWVEETTSVLITENKAAVGESNLEAWALSMGSMLTYMNNYKVLVFGGWTRSATLVNNTRKAFLGGSSWGIESREELIDTVLRMTVAGHNSDFLKDAAIVEQMTPSEYKKLLNNATGIDAYMWPYTKQLSEKWGERGILCWDLFRMSNLVQWGYAAGYLTYAEALVLLEPAAIRLCKNFSSWDEAYENYLDGYNWWARNNVLDQDIWQTTRGEKYAKMKDKYDTLFDDSLFEVGVIPVPNLTIEDILKPLGRSGPFQTV